MVNMFHKIRFISVKKINETVKRTTQSGTPFKHFDTKKLGSFDLSFALRRFDENHTSIKRLVVIENDRNEKKPPIFVFPGFEGRLDGVEPLVSNLQRTIYCLQYPFESSLISIPKMVPSIMQAIKSYIPYNKKINIYAHSFGGMVAMEVIKQLESEGYEVKLCLTDSSPYAIKYMVWITYGDILEIEEFENTLIRRFLKCLGIVNDHEDLLKLGHTWDEKIEILLPEVVKQVPFSLENLKTIFNGIYNVTYAIFYYPEDYEKLNSETTLIRSSKTILPFPANFKISRYFKKPVNEVRTDGHHFNMLKFPKTLQLVNYTFAE